MDIHNVVMDDHDGIKCIHDCCELWISMIVTDIHDLIIDIPNSIMDICNCIIGNTSEDLMF